MKSSNDGLTFWNTGLYKANFCMSLQILVFWFICPALHPAPRMSEGFSLFCGSQRLQWAKSSVALSWTVVVQYRDKDQDKDLNRGPECDWQQLWNDCKFPGVIVYVKWRSDVKKKKILETESALQQPGNQEYRMKRPSQMWYPAWSFFHAHSLNKGFVLFFVQSSV